MSKAKQRVVQPTIHNRPAPRPEPVPTPSPESNVFTVPVQKINYFLDVDTTNMTQATRDFIFLHGLKQLINDTHSGVRVEEEDGEDIIDNTDRIRELVESKAAALSNNQLNVRETGSGVPLDYKKLALRWASANTGQPIKALEGARKVKQLSISQLLQLVCDKLGVSYEEVHAELLEKVRQLSAVSKDSAATVSLDDLLG